TRLRTMLPDAGAAVSVTRVAGSRRSLVVVPGACGTGSQTKVRFVLPSAARLVPIQVRIVRARAGASTASIAFVSCGSATGFIDAGVMARDISSLLSAK